MKIFKKIIMLTLIGYSLFILTSNAKIINSLSVNEKLVEDIGESENLNIVIEDCLLGRDNFMPGDIITDDKIKLVNNEEFPVRFTFDIEKINKIEEINLVSVLDFNIKGTHKLLGENKYVVTVGGNTSKNIYPNFSWIEGENDIIFSGAGAEYIYYINAEKSKILYENYFESENDLEGWLINRIGNFNLMDRGMVIKGYDNYPEVYYTNNNEPNSFPINGLEANAILDLSEFKKGEEKDGFDYFVSLNNKDGQFNVSFVFHIVNIKDEGIYIYSDMLKGLAPSYNKINSKKIESENDIFRLNYKIIDNNGFIEANVSVFDNRNNLLYIKKLHKDSKSLGIVVNESKWNTKNCGGFRKLGFDGLKSKEGVIIKSIELKKN